MRIKKIKISRSEKSLKITNSKGNVYVLKPSRGEKVSRFDLICVVTEIMLEHKKKKSDKMRSSFNEIVNKCDSWKDKAGTIYNQWLTYTNPEKYGNNAPFSISGHGINDGMTTAQNQKKFLPIAKSVFGNEGKGKEAYYWLGDYKSTKIEFDPPLEEKSIETTPEISIFNKEYIQFFKKTEDLGYESLIDLAKGFGIQEPSDGFFKDLYSVPIPEQATLKKHIKDHENVLITGKSKVGKTRLVFDVLKNLKDYYVLSLKSSAFTNVDILKISDFFKQKERKLIWFIDNIDCYQFPLQDPIWDIYAKLCAIDKNTIVIATLRDDMIKPKSRLLENKRIDSLEFRYEIKNTEADNFIKHCYKNKQLPSHYDGTFWSIMYDINYMKDLYNNGDKVNGACRGVMKSLKLLQKILPKVEHTLLKLTFENIYYSFEGTTIFDDSIRKLDKIRFLKVDKSKNIVSSQEPYLDKIVDYPDMDLDMEKLIDILVNNGKFRELLHLSGYYYLRKDFDNCVNCSQHIANNAPSNKLKSAAYSNLGLTLHGIAKLQDSKEKQKEYYNKACDNYEKAIVCKKNSKAYYNWGNALFEIAKLQDSREEQIKYYKKAYEKYKEATNCKKNYAKAYHSWGLAFFKIAKLQDSKEEQIKYYKKACEKYKEAIDYKKDSGKTSYHWGLAILEIAELQKSKEKQKKLCREAYHILFKSYLLSILQDKRSLTDIAVKAIKYIRQEIDDTIHIEEILIFELGLKASLPDNEKSLSKEELDFLQKTKGTFSEGDIIIDAILENKKPDVAEISDDDLLLKTAVFLANRIIDRKRNLKIPSN